MATPMKDKETKEKFDDLLMEVMGSYHDFMMNKISLNKHKAVEQKVGDFIKGVEQEAERRGYERGAEQLRKDITNRVIVGLVGDDDKLYKLKLLEEENGKQNER
jgi:hypothetical protein